MPTRRILADASERIFSEGYRNSLSLFFMNVPRAISGERTTTFLKCACLHENILRMCVCVHVTQNLLERERALGLAWNSILFVKREILFLEKKDSLFF